MPPVLGLRDGDKVLFDDAEMFLHAGDRVCLVGRNGTGKSTLLRVLAGQIEIDEGELFIQPGLRIAYLEQDPRPTPGQTVWQFIEAGSPPSSSSVRRGPEAGGDCPGAGGRP